MSAASAVSTVVRGIGGRHREKVWCPGCRQIKSAVWRRTPGQREPVLTWHNHRVQLELADDEKPIRCDNSGQPVQMTGDRA